ncbi:MULTISPECIES: EpsG family protein [Bifidobacterium]|uniref:EpsG family protein n=1 Tax=Bifidobacterium TaxID=1678 RepID=UPI001BDD341C|nr:MULTISPECIES: EpsG family protein [Bifidobacterium]MBT1162615.1 EpsG family protein [Bifidobacterium sp. SO1]MBW3079770.1 EpsG family protein [Bifidobacterium simiiventris]
MIIYSSVFVVLLIFAIVNYMTSVSQLDTGLKHASEKAIHIRNITHAYMYAGSYLGAPLFILFLLTALRYDVGKDYQHHIDIFHWIQESGPDEVYVEKGYAYFNLLISELGLPVEILFVVGGLLVCGSIFAVAYYLVPARYWSLFVVLFYFGGAFFSSLNLVRQYYAISLCLISFLLFLRKHWIGSLFVFAAAVSCHSAAIIFILVPVLAVLMKSKVTHVFLIILYCLSLIFILVDIHQLILLVEPLVPDRWQHYLNDSQFLDRNKFALLKLVVPNAVLIIYSLTEWKSNLLSRFFAKVGNQEKKDLLVSSDDVVMAGTALFVISQNAFYGVMVLTRMSEFFWMFYYAAIVYLIAGCKKRVVQFGCAGTFLLYFVLLTVVTIFIKNGNDVMPYTFIFAPNVSFS